MEPLTQLPHCKRNCLPGSESSSLHLQPVNGCPKCSFPLGSNPTLSAMFFSN
jgi:hypothetical protein